MSETAEQKTLRRRREAVAAGWEFQETEFSVGITNPNIPEGHQDRCRVFPSAFSLEQSMDIAGVPRLPEDAVKRDPTNLERAERARLVLSLYARRAGLAEEGLVTIAGDLLADMLHMADITEVGPVNLLDEAHTRAVDQHWQEAEGDDPPDKVWEWETAVCGAPRPVLVAASYKGGKNVAALEWLNIDLDNPFSRELLEIHCFSRTFADEAREWLQGLGGLMEAEKARKERTLDFSAVYADCEQPVRITHETR